MLSLLDTLSKDGRCWRHGYELMGETGIRSGTLYPLLMRMTRQGLVEAKWREPELPGRPARHVYRLTVAGSELAQEARNQAHGPIPKSAAIA